MELREKIRRAAVPYVPPGELIQAVIPARTVPSPLLLAPGPTPSEALDIVSAVFQSLFLWLGHRRRVLVVTSTLIVVLDCGRGRFGRPRSVLAVVPRRAVGPPKGLVRHRVTIAGETMRIRRRFFPDITAVG